MSDHIEKIRATVLELQQELDSVDSLDEKTQAFLQDAMRELSDALHKQGVEDFEHQPFTERLTETAREFEQSHPTLAGITGNLIKLLGQIGI